jgi:hypothetical protein
VTQRKKEKKRVKEIHVRDIKNSRRNAEKFSIDRS